MEEDRVRLENERLRLDRAISSLDAFLGYSAANGATRRQIEALIADLAPELWPRLH